MQVREGKVVEALGYVKSGDRAIRQALEKAWKHAGMGAASRSMIETLETGAPSAAPVSPLTTSMAKDN